jgi:pentose-5-phosphate-3-epimerase
MPFVVHCNERHVKLFKLDLTDDKFIDNFTQCEIVIKMVKVQDKT